MGVGWRRFTEGLKQTTHLGADLSPTSNERNLRMLEEATAIEAEIKSLIAKITAANAAHEDLLSTSTHVLTAHLPRVFHEVAHPAPESPTGSSTEAIVKNEANTTAVASSEKQAAAPDLDVEALAAAQHGILAQVQAGVLTPLQEWLNTLASLRQDEKTVDALRLEVDSRRRTVADLSVKLAKEEAALLRSQDSKHADRVEHAKAHHQHKSDKLADVCARFKESEVQLHSRLSALVQDASYLRVYVANALLIQGRGLTQLGSIIEGPVQVQSAQEPEAPVASVVPTRALGTVPSKGQGPLASEATPLGATESPQADVEPVADVEQDPATVPAAPTVVPPNSQAFAFGADVEVQPDTTTASPASTHSGNAPLETPLKGRAASPESQPTTPTVLTESVPLTHAV